MSTLASGFSDFLGNLWFAGMALLVGAIAGWFACKRFGSKF
jgi:hypothetical protein